MTDEDGTVLTTSNRNNDKRENVGYPASPSEIDWYIEMLKRAAPSLSADELGATRKWLKKHVPR
jgi:hypothetical protein